MKLNIGENIKHLRREKDMTQEEFAEILGVSCQSVSRWENNTCYPDMELLPTISDVFQVTLDSLLGVSEAVEEARVAEYLSRYQTAVSEGDVCECIKIAREGVGEYPNNYVLLNKLMEALFISGDSDGNIAEWKENSEKYDAEITSLGERIMKYCTDEGIRAEAMWRLAFNHCEMGRKDIGRKIFEKLPTTDFCRENAMWYCLEDGEKLPYARNQVKKGYQFILAGIYEIVSDRLIGDEELLRIFEKKEALDNIILDGEALPEDWGKARFMCEYAKVLSRLGKAEEALEKLKKADEYAEEFDNRPEKFKAESLLLGERVANRTDFETSDARKLSEILREKWMLSPSFDNIRHLPQFAKIKKECS